MITIKNFIYMKVEEVTYIWDERLVVASTETKCKKEAAKELWPQIRQKLDTLAKETNRWGDNHPDFVGHYSIITPFEIFDDPITGGWYMFGGIIIRGF